MNKRIDQAMKTIRNLPVELLAAQQRSKDHTVPKDSIMNRCVENIGKIRNLAPKDTNQKPETALQKYAVKMLEEAWETYKFLQNFKPRVGESQHWRPGTREFSLEGVDTDEDGNYQLLEDGVAETSAPDPIPVEDEKGNDVEISSPHLYAGGLGYRHVNWDAEYLMAVDGSERHHNPYWNPKEATVKPVKHFTKEEIEALNCPSG